MSAELLVPGLGTTLSTSPDGVTYTAVGDVLEIDSLSLKMGDVDTFNLASTLKTKRPTLLEQPELSVKLQYDPRGTSHTALFTAFTAKTTEYFQIGVNGGGTGLKCTFQGYLSEFEVSGMTAEGNVEADLKIMGNTVPVWS